MGFPNMGGFPAGGGLQPQVAEKPFHKRVADGGLPVRHIHRPISESVTVALTQETGQKKDGMRLDLLPRAFNRCLSGYYLSGAIRS